MNKSVLLVGATSLVLASGLTSSCSRDHSCRPSPLSVSSSAVEAGSALTVSAAPATCTLGYPNGKTYTLDLALDGQASSHKNFKAREVPVNTNDSFSADIVIPAGMPTGDAGVLVTGSPLDSCGAPGSCAAYSAAFRVE